MNAKTLLKKAKVGDVFLFTNGVKGVVIDGGVIEKKCVVNEKALLLLNFSNGDLWLEVANGKLDYEAKIIGKFKEVEQ